MSAKRVEARAGSGIGALGNVNQILYTPKSRKIIEDDAKVITLFGSTGNGKTMLATYKFLSRVWHSPKSHKFFVLAGRDISTLERRFVSENANHSVFNWKPFKGKWRHYAQGVGGGRVECYTRTGTKVIYLTPFGNISTYSRVLGDTIYGVLIDEAVESDETFLQEIITRVERTKGSFLIQTSNGGDPKHFFYTGIVDKSYTLESRYFEWVNGKKVYSVLSEDELRAKGIRLTPYEELKYFEPLERRKKDYMAYHMGLEDNPVYGAEQLENLYNTFPYGSYMYFSRILGVRGFTEDSPFSQYMTKDIYVKREDLRASGLYPFEITWTVDGGGHVFSNREMVGSIYREGERGTEKGGHTVMLTVGFSRDYRRVVVLDTYFPNRLLDQENVNLINHRVNEHIAQFPSAKRESMYVDAAASNLYSSLVATQYNVRAVKPAVKWDKFLDISEKNAVALVQQFMMRGDFKVLDTPENRRWFEGSMVGAKQDITGKILDNLSWESDVWDTLKYTFMSMYRLLIDRDGR